MKLGGGSLGVSALWKKLVLCSHCILVCLCDLCVGSSAQAEITAKAVLWFDFELPSPEPEFHLGSPNLRLYGGFGLGEARSMLELAQESID